MQLLRRYLAYRKARKGFGKQEIVAAMVIFGVLGGTVAGLFRNYQVSQQHNLAAEIATVQAAVDRYHVKMKDWPAGDKQPVPGTPAPLNVQKLITDGYLRQIPADFGAFGLKQGMSFGITNAGTVYLVDATALPASCTAVTVYVADDTTGTIPCDQLK